MKTLARIFLAVALAVLSSSASAQFSGNGQTNTINTATNWAGNYYVGSNTTYDVLWVTNGGVLTNAFAYIGYETSGSNNTVQVDGAGGSASWISSTNLVVGRAGSRNQLLIVGGGKVSSAGNTSGSGTGSGGIIGNNSGANSNSVVVSGSGSVWTNNGTLFVGNSGAFNQLTITNGGVVISSGGSGGTAANTAIGEAGNSNSVLVSGSGSLWTNNGFVYIGRGGSFNSLTISNRGTVVNGESQITWSGGKSNVVTVTGSGSSWTNTGKITVGFDTTFGNQLMIADSGTVVSVGTSVIGGNASSRSNLVTVTGSGSRWTNNGVITVGSAGSFNQLIITNGGKVFSAGGVAANIGNSASAISNQVLVTGSGSLWNMNSYFGVGGGCRFRFQPVDDCQ